MERIDVTQEQLRKEKIHSDYSEWCKLSDGFHWVFIKCCKCNHHELHYSHVQTTRGCKYLLTGICGHLYGRLEDKKIPIDVMRRENVPLLWK